ncbi:hypothetical protein G7067_11175 [Leucobacter insecticola]|uniref:Uncharacterized protein n=1 Tax=Leucobacter insecticola TaxID=2714934 RepID=A0A6G8FKE4_9MICO|nr:hypothetical protein [Leucobacter insecticola]QIM16837.1 hypothetical protein G7067_11175 [Leucobacter insecticola]
MTTLSAVAGIALALAGTGVSDALWNAQAEVADLQVVAGTPGLEIALGTEPGVPATTVLFPEETWTKMLPGDAACSAITVTNSGDIPLSLQARTNDLTGAPMTILLSEGPCDAPSGPAFAGTEEPTELAEPLAPQASRTFGVTVSINTDASNTYQGKTVAPELVVFVTGRSVPSQP